MPRLSIIIPLLGQTDLLESTLVSVLEHRPHNCEIIVVTRDSYEDPYQLDGEVRFITAEPKSSFVECVRLGITQSEAAIVHILASGVEVTEGWADHALAHFEDRRIAAVAPLMFDLIDHRKLVSAGLRYRSGGIRRYAKRPKTDQTAEVLGPAFHAAFYRKSALELVGGVPHQVGDQLGDLDLALQLKHAGFKSIVDPSSQVQGTGQPVVTTNSFLQALYAERLFWRNLPQTGWLQTGITHPLLVATEFVRNCYRPAGVAKLMGRFIGFCQLSGHLQHHKNMEQRKLAAAEVHTKNAPQNNLNLRIDQPHTSEKSTAPSAANPEVRTPQ